VDLQPLKLNLFFRQKMKSFWIALSLPHLLFLSAQAEWQALWPEGAPGSPNPPVVQELIKPAGAKHYLLATEVSEEDKKSGRFTDTAQPAYWFYPADPAKRNGAAVVIFPGGGYSILAAKHEGHDYAKWLSERGIAAVLVKYRVSRNDEAGFHYPVPYLDARRAIRMTRENAAEWQIDPNKVGVMGSSAGGHLASMCVTLYDEIFNTETLDQSVSCRPDFGILVYPVIGMDQAWGHGGSRRRLLGPNNSDGLAKRLATHRRVTENTPPCFLIHAADDTVVPVQNSLEFASACARHGVPVVLQVSAEGGHGFGLSGQGDAADWPDLLERWLESEPWK
jgi:acetyl esterase/lipase